MKKKSILAQLMSFAGKYKYLTYASWILSATSALVALMTYYCIWKIIREVLIVAPDFSQAQNIVSNGWFAVGFAASSVLIYIAGLLCSHLSAFRIATNIRSQLMRHIFKLPIGEIERIGSGKLRKTVHECAAATETYLAHRLPDRAGAVVTPLGILFLLLFFDWRLGLLCLAPIALGFFALTKMTGMGENKMKQYENALSDMANQAVEYVRGMPVIKTFGQTIFSFKKFKRSIDYYKHWAISYTRQCQYPWITYIVIINSVFIFLIFAGLYFTRTGLENKFITDFLFYVIISPVISVTLSKIMYQSRDALQVKDALERINSVFAIKPLYQSLLPQKPKDTSIELQNVSYGYDGKTYALNDVSFRIEHGQTVAFVGPSGGGKTTLAGLLARFFDPQKGNILIGGTDIKQIEKKDLVNTISFVFQNNRLLKTSILENVRLAKPDASRSEVLEALEKAQCKDILEKLPSGADTVIGTDGIFLSGGQQQRIAIARVILKNTPIVILDEATAFADPDNETLIQKAFGELSKNRTVIMIAHRLSTVINADKIFVVKDGRIEESGTYEQLERQNGIFARMWQNFQTSVKWKVAKEV